MMNTAQERTCFNNNRRRPMERVYYFARLLWAKGMVLGASLGCHQLPERSFSIRGYQFPVCARCTGTFAGEILCLAGYFAFGLLLPPLAAIAYCFVMLFDWVAQQLDWYRGNNASRFITGILGGLGGWTLLLTTVIALFKLLA